MSSFDDNLFNQMTRQILPNIFFFVVNTTKAAGGLWEICDDVKDVSWLKRH